MEYLGWSTPFDCINFNAWVYWEVYFAGEKFVRILGFEFTINTKE